MNTPSLRELHAARDRRCVDCGERVKFSHVRCQGCAEKHTAVSGTYLRRECADCTQPVSAGYIRCPGCIAKLNRKQS